MSAIATYPARFTAFTSFADGGVRGAFLQTARGALDRTGQRLGGIERLYLLADVPVLLVVGGRDPVIPADHTVDAHHVLPGSHLAIFEGAGHFPHAEEPGRFAEQLLGFLTTTIAARGDVRSLRRRLCGVEGQAVRSVSTHPRRRRIS